MTFPVWYWKSGGTVKKTPCTIKITNTSCVQVLFSSPERKAHIPIYLELPEKHCPIYCIRSSNLFCKCLQLMVIVAAQCKSCSGWMWRWSGSPDSWLQGETFNTIQSDFLFSLLLSFLPVIVLWLNLHCLVDVVAASCVTAKHKDDEEGGSLPRSHQEFFCCVMLLFVNSFLLSLVQNKAIVKLWRNS